MNPPSPITPVDARGMVILALCDSPTIATGFSRVVQNFFSRWHAAGAVIDVWGIGYDHNSAPEIPYVRRFYAAGAGGRWHHAEKLQQFIDRLGHPKSDYTHCFILQDSFALSQAEFPQVLKEICSQRKIRSLCYFPVDAPLEPEWCEIMSAVDRPVAYTEFGRMEAEEKAAVKKWNLDIAVVPHGVDTSVYYPLPAEKRAVNRCGHTHNGQPWIQPDDFVVLNVNANQPRKDIPRTLEVFARLKERVPNAKLILHMTRRNAYGIDIENVAKNLGLQFGVDYVHHTSLFDEKNGLSNQPESFLNLIYNIADVYLTTTLGEGWGLGITEALAAGLPVVCPDHTACREISRKVAVLSGDSHYRIFTANVEDHSLVMASDNSRLRKRIQVASAVQILQAIYEQGVHRERPPLHPAVAQWQDWDRISAQMLGLLKGDLFLGGRK